MKLKSTNILVILLLAFLVFFFQFAFPIYANETAPDRETAASLLTRYSDIRFTTKWNFEHFDGNIDLADDSTFLDKMIERTFTKEQIIDGKTVTRDCHWFFLPVDERYTPDNVKNAIRDTFVADLAEKVISEASGFFDEYIEEDDRFYHRVDLGRAIDPGTEPYVFFKPEEFDSIEIVSAGENLAKASVPAHRHIVSLIDAAPRQESFNITFVFKCENGEWKISGVDFMPAVFTVLPNDIDLSGDFSEETAKTLIEAAVFNLYNYIVCGGYEPHTAYSNESSRLVTDSRTYVLLEENIGDSGAWRQYAESCCTQEIYSKILQSGTRNYREEGGKSYASSYYISDASFDLKKLDSSQIELVSQTANTAKVVYNYIHSPAGSFDLDGEWPSVPVTVEFTKTGNGWRVSGGDFIEKLNDSFGLVDSNTDTGDSALVVFSCITVLLLAAGLLIGSLKLRKQE